jgi:hypothetical protein
MAPITPVLEGVRNVGHAIARSLFVKLLGWEVIGA